MCVKVEHIQCCLVTPPYFSWLLIFKHILSIFSTSLTLQKLTFVFIKFPNSPLNTNETSVSFLQIALYMINKTKIDLQHKRKMNPNSLKYPTSIPCLSIISKSFSKSSPSFPFIFKPNSCSLQSYSILLIVEAEWFLVSKFRISFCKDILRSQIFLLLYIVIPTV